MNKEQLKKLERDLWAAADKLRANCDLKASEYSTPVLGLIFLKFADNKNRQQEDAILAEYSKLKGTRRERSLQDIAIEKCGFALGPQARYDYLLNLPEKEGIVLHAFEGKTPFGAETLENIEQLRAIYQLALDASASHQLTEEPAAKRTRTKSRK